MTQENEKKEDESQPLLVGEEVTTNTSTAEATVVQDSTSRVRFLNQSRAEETAGNGTSTTGAGSASVSASSSNNSLKDFNDSVNNPYNNNKYYGSTNEDTTTSTSLSSNGNGNNGNGNGNDFDVDASVHSFHLGMRKVNISNVWTSMRMTQSFMDFGDDYQQVPSELADNVKLVTDPNLDPREKGCLYYSEESFYNKDVKPSYALTVHPDIYKRMLKEINDASCAPCGLYFCCHGGDAAHAGVSHSDFVDIKVAWTLLVAIFSAMMITSTVAPHLIAMAADQQDDDFFVT